MGNLAYLILFFDRNPHCERGFETRLFSMVDLMLFLVCLMFSGFSGWEGVGRDRHLHTFLGHASIFFGRVCLGGGAPECPPSPEVEEFTFTCMPKRT